MAAAVNEHLVLLSCTTSDHYYMAIWFKGSLHRPNCYNITDSLLRISL